MRHLLAITVPTILAGVALVAQAPRPTPTLFVDGHVHMTNRVYWERINPWVPQPVGLFDYARARQGGVNVVIDNLAAYGFDNYNGTVKQVARLIETFHRTLEVDRDKMELALTGADVRRIVSSGKLAVILGIEQGFDQDGDLDVLRLWHRLGVRLIQFASPTYADRGEGGKWGGINDHARRLIAEMNRLGIIIDITHASEAAMRQIIETSEAPVVASHVGLRSVSDRVGFNVPDDIAKAVAAKGGMIGIISVASSVSQRYLDWSRGRPATGLGFLSTGTPLLQSRAPDYGAHMTALDAELGNRWRQAHAQPWRDDPQAYPMIPTIDDWADHVARAVALVGPAHVGIGLDLFQGRSHLKDFDALGYNKLADALAKRKVLTPVLGENWLRLLDAAKVQ